ncbi:MAG TPA: hypothetical protein EYG60_03435, partial [Campylobacterales bacterium]|nr:hypothetical protein [Campylobacterales bacterium]
MKSKPKKLKTEQMMRVQIGSFGTIEIGHKTEMGKVSQVMDMGNRLRQIKGLTTIPLEEILRRPGFWEFVIALDTQKFEYTEQMIKSGNIPDFKNILNLDGM